MDFLDLFSGIGGFRLGMEQAGHICKGHCEIDKFADKSYRAMHNVKESEWYANDIRNVKPEDLPKAECYCGGFPCQAFSIAGKRGGFEDMRGTLVFEVFRLAKANRPKILFLENVAGLFSHDNGKTFGTIITAMDELGYDAEWQLLNSKDYGVPQNRERVFIIGHLRGRSRRNVFPITRSNEQTLKQIIAGGQGAKTGLYLINKDKDSITFRNDFNCLDANYFKGLDAHQARTGVLEVRPVLTPDREEKKQNGRRMKENGEDMFTLTAQDRHGVMIAKTVRCGGGGSPYDSKSNWDSYEINGRIRRLTPKECFRLQGFPDSYFEKAEAVNSNTQLYKQAGNSVTVNVIYEIAKKL